MSNLPKGWEKVSLKEVVEDMHQGINTVTENIEYHDNGIDILQAKHITSGYIDLSDPKKVSIEDYNKYKSKYQPQINHILLTNIGTIGKVLIVEENISFLIAWNIFLIKSNHSKINPYFLFHILKKYDIDKFYDKFLTGNATKFINKKFMGDIEILLPPLEEQKKIADILSTVDKKIAFVEENINATEELKKGLMQKLLTEGIGHTEFKDSELGRIPESWEVKKLGNIGSLEGGYAFKSGEYNIEGKGYQVIRMSNVNTFGLNLVKDPKYLESIEEKAKKYILNIGDILITLTGTIGKTDYGNVAFIDINKPMVLNQRVGRFVPKKNNYNKFFFYVFNFSLFRNKFFEFGQGGTGNQANVGKNDFESIEIIVPPFEEQKQIAEILSTVDNKLENLKEKKLLFQELKKGLMQKLLTGEVRV